MLDLELIQDFLAQRRIAVVGASADPKKFGTVLFRELLARGYDAVPVNPSAVPVGGVPAYPSLVDVPGGADGALLVTTHGVLDVLGQAAAAGIPRVWLVRGVGSPGAWSEVAVARAEHLGLQVVAGACPMMFLDPVRGVHRLHRGVRRLRGEVPKAG